MKCIDCGGILRRKAEVQTRLLVGWNRVLGLDDPERNAVATVPVTQQRSRGPQALVSERLQYGVVKALASVDVPYPDRNVSESWASPRECYAASWC